jgi:hypothetical protein
MSGTALDHPLIRGYLRELDAAFAGSPAGPARELREQITAHLQDALPPGAGDQEVAAALARLGSPASLAAEARGAVPAPPLTAQARRRVRAALARRTWRFWSIAAAAVLLAGSVAGYVTAVQTAGVLQAGAESGWWYRQDGARQVMTSADGAQQDTVPIRFGQRQGLFFILYNPGDWTQRVLGPGGRGWQSPGSLFAQFSVSAPGPGHGGYPGDAYSVRYHSLPGDIPPHQWRALRVLWTSSSCMSKGGSTGMDQLVLRVRIGWSIRTETIPLGGEWALSGTAGSECPR